MQLFKCHHCGQILYFENDQCGKCGHRLGYDPVSNRLLALDPNGETWKIAGAPDHEYRSCANAVFGVCNWLIDATTPDIYCVCCRHNRTVPDTAVPDNVARWKKIEIAKHRLFYSLIRLRLPLDAPQPGGEPGLAFNFLAVPIDGSPRVMTGHDNGLITIALAEADDAERERARVALHEPYRTLLGHFRHEVGHYYWDRLVRDDPARLEDCRALFGDERLDYGQALEIYYANGTPPDWQGRFVSAYATSHPWEDFAETWAHYLHIVDTLEIAGAFDVSVHPRLARGTALDATVDFDPYAASAFDQLVETWMPLSVALNSFNRAMGQPDLYPFVLSPPAIAKLEFAHRLVHPAQALADRQAAAAASAA